MQDSGLAWASLLLSCSSAGPSPTGRQESPGTRSHTQPGPQPPRHMSWDHHKPPSSRSRAEACPAISQAQAAGDPSLAHLGQRPRPREALTPAGERRRLCRWRYARPDTGMFEFHLREKVLTGAEHMVSYARASLFTWLTSIFWRVTLHFLTVYLYFEGEFGFLLRFP